MTRIHPGASITVTDADGVPMGEIPVRHTYGDGEAITAPLPVHVSRQAEDALLADILRRFLITDGPYRAVTRKPGRPGTLDLDGDIPLTPRETAWLIRRYPHLEG